MKQLFGLRAMIALLLVGVSSVAGLMLGTDIDAVLIALVGGTAAVLLAAGTTGDEDEVPPPAPARPRCHRTNPASPTRSRRSANPC